MTRPRTIPSAQRNGPCLTYVPVAVKLVATLCAFIGTVQFFFSHSLFGLVWIVAAAIIIGVDRYYGD